MSFRNTFVTDFIYSAGDQEYIKAFNKISGILSDNTSSMDVHGHDGMGYFTGLMSTSSLGLDDLFDNVYDLVNALCKVTKVPFRLTVMQESGAVLTFTIEPRT